MSIVDIQFNLNGSFIPVDHGYLLYSAISEIVPEFHENPDIGIFSISGNHIGNRQLSITKNSKLIIRLPSEEIGNSLKLAGKTIKIQDKQIQIGVPMIRALIPSANLYSRLVIIKGFMEPEQFLEAVKRQLDELEIKGKPYLVEQNEILEANIDKKGGSHSPYLRRTINIRNKEIVGFALRVKELDAEESITLQEKGIGGRRRFGCGLFVPDRR